MKYGVPCDALSFPSSLRFSINHLPLPICLSIRSSHCDIASKLTIQRYSTTLSPLYLRPTLLPRFQDPMFICQTSECNLTPPPTCWCCLQTRRILLSDPLSPCLTISLSLGTNNPHQPPAVAQTIRTCRPFDQLQA